MTDIAKVLSGMFRERGWDRRLGLHAVFHFWDEVVGSAVALQARPSLIRGKVLWVSVSDSVWMQQLHLQKPSLLERINQRLEGETISDIRFQLDLSLGKQEETRGAPPEKSNTVDPARQRDFERMADALGNNEAKRTLKRLWLKSQKKSRP